ncbi:pentapeptide repeat-containing protein [Roseibium suaedae]|nr:pentapeptide repeat-containing protein [Roseibium suaedae]
MALIVANQNVEWTWQYWGEHTVNQDGITATRFDRSAISRNFFLGFLAVVGLGLAIWRSWLSYLQTRTGLRQAATAERGLIIDRYQKGALMLESEELTVRLAGVYALRDLALSDPDETYILVLDVLTGFVRERTQKDIIREDGILSDATPKAPPKARFAPDLQEAIDAVSHIRNKVSDAILIEREAQWSLRIINSNLRHINLSYKNLTNGVFAGSIFDKAFILCADFSNCRLVNASFWGATVIATDISGANLKDVTMSAHTTFKVWAYEDNLPQDVPEELRKAIPLRHRSEPWGDFVNRAIKEWPDANWETYLKSFPPISDKKFQKIE